MIVSLFAVSLTSVVINLALGLTGGESITSRSMLIAVCGGFFANALANITWRMSALATDNLGVYAIGFVILLLSLLWLFWIAHVSVARFDFLLIGTMTIITANLLLNFQAEIRLGFKMLLGGLGGFGTFIYVRESVIQSLGVDNWHWPSGGYFEALALSATVFTLLLAFRVSRLISRTDEEDNRTFVAFRRVRVLVERGVIDKGIMECMSRLDSLRSQPGSEEVYKEARSYFDQAYADPDLLRDIDIQLLIEAEASLDTLAGSKQQDVTPGEMFALIIFAAISISLAIFSRPLEIEGWSRLLVDVFAMLISSVILFLLVNVWDLRRERDEGKVMVSEDGRDYAVRFLDNRIRSFDQRFSIVVGLIIAFVYAGLLAHRWIGWFSWLDL